jgi:hypothetical protein
VSEAIGTQGQSEDATKIFIATRTSMSSRTRTKTAGAVEEMRCASCALDLCCHHQAYNEVFCMKKKDSDDKQKEPLISSQ